MTAKRTAVTFVALVALLGAVAAVAPAPWYQTDRDVYEATARQGFITDCSDIHCFRVLVPWTLGRLPGSSLFKWKAYAVLATASAAIALGRVSTILGLTSRAAIIGTWIAAFGAVPMLTLFDPFTADPLMFLLGPLLTADLVIGGRGRVAIAGAVGVLAKEFAAAPLWIFTLWAALRRRWDASLRGLTVALGVTLVWVALQLTLMLRFNYSYAGSASSDVFGGGYLARWLSFVTPRTAASVMVSEFGALLLLAPAGLVRCGKDVRMLAVAALPAAAAFAYVQQPDRALWNFHFIVIPLAALVLQHLSDRWCALFIASYALANLRIGAQLRFLPPAGYPLALSSAIAVVAIVLTFRNRESIVGIPAWREGISPPMSRRTMHRVLAAEVLTALLFGSLVLDISLHKRVEIGRGVNTRGFRGVARVSTLPRGHRVAVLGGSAAYGYGVDWPATFPYVLERLMNESDRWNFPGVPTDVVNLAAIGDGAASYVGTLEAYAYLGADVVCVYDGYAEPRNAGTRRESAIFSRIGYLPILPALIGGDHRWAGGARPAVAPALDDRRGDASALSCERESAGYCASMIATVHWAIAHHASVTVVTPPYLSARHRAQQTSLAAELGRQFGGRADVQHVSLGDAIDLADADLAFDHMHLTPAGHRRVAERLVDPLLNAIADRGEPRTH
jgi:hypothetical protein